MAKRVLGVSLAATIAVLLIIFCSPPNNPSPQTHAAVSVATSTPPVVAAAAAEPAPCCCHEAAADETSTSGKEPECAALTQWAEDYIAAEPAKQEAMEADGIVLADKHRETLSRLIASEPERALVNALPMALRQKLPLSVTSHLEQRISGRANFETSMTMPLTRTEKPQVFRDAVVNDKRYKAYVYGKRTNIASEKNVLMHGIAVGDKLAVHENPVRVLEDGELPDPKAPIGNPDKKCPVSGNLASRAVDAGGTIWYVCSHGHIEALGADQQAIGQGDVASAGGINKTGANTLLYIRVDFSDHPGEPISVTSAQNAMAVVNSFYQENSYNKTSITTTVTSSVYRLPQTGATYANNFAGLINDAITAANANYTTSNYNLIVVACAYLGNGAAGQGYVNARGCALYGYFDLRVTAHELGHNYGVWHANYFTANPADGSSGGNEEYGDSYDTMGFGDSSGQLHFNAQFKKTFGWLSTSQVQSVTSSGTYRVYAYDTASLPSANIGALSIAKPGDTSNRVYWASLRQKITGNKYLMNGVDLHWAPWGSSNGGTHLLDTTWGSGPGKSDSAVVVGRTYSDTVSGVHITPVAKNATTPPSMDITVNIGAFSGNSAPSATIGASNSAPAPNVTTTLTASATDPNGDTLAYLWDFGDGSFSTASSATQNKSWAAAGNYTVTCTVSDMKGGKTTASKVISVGGTVNISPVASFTATPGTGTAPLAVSFNASASSDSDGTISSYAWNFGDGATASGATANHTFAAGTYTVTLTVTDNGGATGSTTRTVSATQVTNQAPVASFTATPTSGNAPLNVSFNGSASSDPDGTIASYAWNFGDGSTGSGSTASHTYAAGTWTATLTVTDNSGAANSKSTTISVATPPPPPPQDLIVSSGPTATPNPAKVGQVVTFAAAATGGTQPYSWSWNFGDGTSATTAGSASHTYRSVGTYTMTLTVRDAAGASAQKAVTVTVKKRNGKSGALTVSKVSGSLNYTASGKDSITLTGTLDQSVSLKGASVSVDVNGETTTFQVGMRGTGKSGLSTFRVTGNKVQFTLKGQSLSAALGADPTATKGQVDISVSIGNGDDGYDGATTVTLTNRAGKSGVLKK